ncbi:hypothetical protein BKA62DRAFT_767492 [Auriculariales sp. MPI-PUGE-AT-0066]|nr:hypothetical protein BKA62DRAFT_767492 [Auriculariales sp. MPI-PUGE-AT-0066]
MGASISAGVVDEELDKAIMDALVKEAKFKDDNSKAGIRAFLESYAAGWDQDEQAVPVERDSVDGRAQVSSAQQHKAERDHVEREARWGLASR